MQEILVLPTLPVACRQQSRFLARAHRAAVWAGLGDTRLSWGSTGRAGGSRNPALCSAEPGTALGFLEMRQMFCWVFLHAASQLLGTETEAHLSSTVHLYKIHGKTVIARGIFITAVTGFEICKMTEEKPKIAHICYHSYGYGSSQQEKIKSIKCISFHAR